MLINLVGYNVVKYSRDGEERDFVKVFVKTDKSIDYGHEYISVILSSRYWYDKILPAFNDKRSVHIGFESKKGNKPFLYVK